MTPKQLFAPEVLDRLEGLNERYAALARQLELLFDEAATFDIQPDPGTLGELRTTQGRVKAEAEALLLEVVAELENRPS